jgi:hypothetical protein
MTGMPRTSGKNAVTTNTDCIFAADSNELVRYALTTPFDSMFFLILNILRMRNDDAALAELGAGVTANEESLDRRLATARVRGDARGAMDMLAREGGVVAQVPDLIATAHNAGSLPQVIDTSVGTQSLQSWYHPIVGFHALLERLTRGAPAELRSRLEILPPRDGARHDPLRLAGIAKVHNEGARVARTVGTLLDLCDDVVLWDHDSGDGSIDALDSLPASDRARLQIVRSKATEYHEGVIYDELFARARACGATHICHYDADEVLAPALTRERVRQIAAGLHPGDAASFERIQQVGVNGDHIDYSRDRNLALSQYYLPQWRDFIFADDGRSVHATAHIHGGWLPVGHPRRRMFLDPASEINFHMDIPNAEAAQVKNDWYKAKELLLHGLPVEKLVYRYMFYALTYAHLDASLARGPAVEALMDARIEALRTSEKKGELARWLADIKSPLERWLFFHA